MFQQLLKAKRSSDRQLRKDANVRFLKEECVFCLFTIAGFIIFASVGFTLLSLPSLNAKPVAYAFMIAAAMCGIVFCCKLKKAQKESHEDALMRLYNLLSQFHCTSLECLDALISEGAFHVQNTNNLSIASPQNSFAVMAIIFNLLISFHDSRSGQGVTPNDVRFLLSVGLILALLQPVTSYIADRNIFEQGLCPLLYEIKIKLITGEFPSFSCPTAASPSQHGIPTAHGESNTPTAKKIRIHRIRRRIITKRIKVAIKSTKSF